MSSNKVRPSEADFNGNLKAIRDNSRQLAQQHMERHLKIKKSITLPIRVLATGNKPRERRNGLDCPFSCQQVGIWINTATTIASTVAWLFIPIAKDIFDTDHDDDTLT